MAIPQPTSLDFYKEAATQELPGVSGNLSGVEDRGMGELLVRFLSVAMVVGALLLLLYLLWGAIEWISSGGDKSKVEKARNRITQAVIGIIVMASTLAIFMAVQNFLGIKLIDFQGSSASTRNIQNIKSSKSTGAADTIDTSKGVKDKIESQELQTENN